MTLVAGLYVEFPAKVADTTQPSPCSLGELPLVVKEPFVAVVAETSPEAPDPLKVIFCIGIADPLASESTSDPVTVTAVPCFTLGIVFTVRVVLCFPTVTGDGAVCASTELSVLLTSLATMLFGLVAIALDA